jgi:ubiquinone/menaquinone biosynthesis C-methylase UbiE
MTTLASPAWPAATDLRPTVVQRWNAAVYDPFLALGERRGMAARRRRVLAEAHGRVVEVGAGTGLNLPHYPGTVAELVLTEPEAGMAIRLRRKVTRLGRGGPVAADGLDPRVARVVPAPAQALPFPDSSFDVAVATMVLCTVPDPVAAIAELRRVLRPGGRVLVVEHIWSDGRPALARWQRRLRRAWQAFAAGCRADQDTARLLSDAGFDTRGLRRETWSGMPPLVHPLLVGTVPVP